MLSPSVLSSGHTIPYLNLSRPQRYPLADLPRDKRALIAENALLRHKLVIPRRSVKRPRCTALDQALLVLLARWVGAWQQALVIVQPDTLSRPVES